MVATNGALKSLFYKAHIPRGQIKLRTLHKSKAVDGNLTQRCSERTEEFTMIKD
jgi:hypothetical protein